ncbi:MAG TPA: dihydrodipicolinate synthase family protein [Bacillota bacterium]|nr:dihydrodipicolinate synthase family protein [Bacillota bacterium]
MMKITNGMCAVSLSLFGTDGSIDAVSLAKLNDFYAQSGCSGVFTACQSGEIFGMSLKKRIELAQLGVKLAHERNMFCVASANAGHDIEESAYELTAVVESGADAAVIITNRLDVANTSDSAWCRDAQRLIMKLPADAKLGLYECPYPYKRLLSTEMLRFCADTGRFVFIKDTCCDPDTLAKRLALLDGTGIKLFNANIQTLAHSLSHGAAGYCGVMANLFPSLVMDILESPPEEIGIRQAFATACSVCEFLAYPAAAKELRGLPAYCLNGQKATAYDMYVLRQIETLIGEALKRNR